MCVVGVLWSLASRKKIAIALLVPFMGLYIFSYVQVLPATIAIPSPLMTTAPILAVFGSLLLSDLLADRSWHSVRGMAVAAALVACAANALAVDIVLLRDTRYLAEEWLTKHTEDSTSILMFGARIDVPRAGELRAHSSSIISRSGTRRISS